MSERAVEIYVVDDEPLVRETIVTMLATAGYTAVCFSDGAGLMAQMNIRAPLCVFLDVNIPGMSGLDVLREIRASRDGVPMIAADQPDAFERHPGDQTAGNNRDRKQPAPARF